MRKFSLIILAMIVVGTGAFFLTSYPATRREAPRHYFIGVVVRGTTYAPGVEGFKKKMDDLGYVEGKNIRYDIAFVENREELPAAMRRLIEAGVDVIHTYSTPVTVAAYEATKTIPIVFGSMGDPLASKTIQSLQSSGTNVTGVSSLSAPLAAKRLEFLLEAVPRIRRVAIPFTLDDIPGKSSYEAALDAAKKLAVHLVVYPVSPERSARDTAKAILAKDVDGMVISSDSAVWASLDAYVAQATQEKLPFAVFDKDMVVKGGLIGYGPDYAISGEQSAVIVDRILKGQRPTDLPIEAPQKFILAVNLDTADAIGITFPKSLLEKADLIIKSQ